jgi:predicted MFS family arabinose efflux permease
MREQDFHPESSALPRAQAAARGQWSLYLGVTFAMMVGHSALVSLPFEVGAIREGLHLDTSRTGLLATVELVAFAVTNIVLAPYAGRLSTRRVSLLGSFLVVAASLISAFAIHLSVFAVSRGAAGVGFGVMFASANVAGAGARVPERAYAIGLAISTVFYSLMPLVLSRSGDLFQLMPRLLWPHSGVFLAMAAFVLVMSPTMLFLPDARTETQARDRALRAARPRSAAIVASLLVMGCFAIAVFSPYTFIQLRAQAIGMRPQAIGSMLSIAIALGISGTVAAAWIGRSRGITLPLTSGLLVQGVCCVVVCLGQTDVTLFGATIAYMTAWSFSYPYLFGLGAAIDPLGRLPTAIGAMYLIGSGVAASVGGALMQFRGYEAVGWSAFVLCALAAGVAFPLARRLDAQSALRLACAELKTTGD